MLTSERKYKAVVAFYEDIMFQEKAAERFDEAYADRIRLSALRTSTASLSKTSAKRAEWPVE